MQPIFISIDPERDTPAVLKQYCRRLPPAPYRAHRIASGDREVAKRYGIYFAKRKEPGTSDYLVDHSRMAMLFGPDGKPIAIVPDDKGRPASPPN